MTRQRQLTLAVAPMMRTVAGERVPAEVLGGEAKLKGALAVDEDLEHGDELIVTVAGVDGQVVSRHYATVDRPPSFVPIEEEDYGLIGYSRAHSIKIGDKVGDQ